MTPAILIAWSTEDEAWLATAVDAGDVSALTGPTTADARTPTLALDALLEKRLLLGDDAWRPSSLPALKWQRVAGTEPRGDHTSLVCAPNKGETVLVWAPLRDEPSLANLSPGVVGLRWQGAETHKPLNWSPTHWARLPSPPKTGGAA